MQFSIISLVAALAASTTSAAYIQTNYTSIATPHVPAGTAAPTGSASPSTPTSSVPFTGGASMPQAISGSALGLVIAGGVALML
ncbi:predicted protein [Plenodomus lingam JN3]|uniref:Uncharacterized protein n=1 Tax=Leptosphaeria maculans (strain JN3 / isolate v23.1.3 / race Av1-4-5-6-7-8) TaxID=985895 RepID=E4ZGI4_LEPMJ|nr:predicted protein [Plenodomus lingam JN3]CBX90404.1 predicted protein [Plenodomus lingam JN3]